MVFRDQAGNILKEGDVVIVPSNFVIGQIKEFNVANPQTGPVAVVLALVQKQASPENGVVPGVFSVKLPQQQLEPEQQPEQRKSSLIALTD